MIVQAADITQHRAGMAHSFDHVTGAGLALGADHGRAFTHPAQGLAQVAAAAYEGHLEGVLVNVVGFIGRGEHLGFVDVIDADGLQNLSLDKVADAAFGHHRDGDRVHDLEDQFGVTHAGHAAIRADISRHPLESHHGRGAGIFGNFGMFGGDHVHDHAAFEHLGQAFFKGKCVVDNRLCFHFKPPWGGTNFDLASLPFTNK